MSTHEAILRAMRMLSDEVPEGSTVILFGSHARSQATSQSDIDLLVVEPSVANRLRETDRLAKVIKWLRIPYDLIVFSRETFEQWKDVPGTLPFEVARDGKVLDELA